MRCPIGHAPRFAKAPALQGAVVGEGFDQIVPLEWVGNRDGTQIHNGQFTCFDECEIANFNSYAKMPIDLSTFYIYAYCR
jgi:hypothetical protein